MSWPASGGDVGHTAGDIGDHHIQIHLSLPVGEPAHVYLGRLGVDQGGGDRIGVVLVEDVA